MGIRGRVEDGLKVVHNESNSGSGGFGDAPQSSVRAFKLKPADVNGPDQQPVQSFKYNPAISSKWKVSCCHKPPASSIATKYKRGSGNKSSGRRKSSKSR